MFELYVLIILFFVIALISCVTCVIESHDFNHKKIVPLNGKAKYKPEDFFISNFIYYLLLCIIYTFALILFGNHSMILITLAFSIIYSVTIDKVLLKNKVESSNMLLIPTVSRLFTNLILIALFILVLIWG